MQLQFLKILLILRNRQRPTLQRSVFSWPICEELKERSFKPKVGGDLKTKGAQPAPARPSSGLVSFLPLPWIRRKFFFAYCLRLVLSQSRARYLFSLCTMHALPHGVMVSSPLSWMFGLCFTPEHFGKLECLHVTGENTKAWSYWSEWLCPGPAALISGLQFGTVTAFSLETQPLLKAHSRGAALCPGSR